MTWMFIPAYYRYCFCTFMTRFLHYSYETCGVQDTFDLALHLRQTAADAGCGDVDALPAVDLTYDTAFAVAEYRIQASGNYPNEDPSGWKIEGFDELAGDGAGAWAAIDAREGELFGARFETRRYAVEGDAARTCYRRYRLTARRSSAEHLHATKALCSTALRP